MAGAKAVYDELLRNLDDCADKLSPFNPENGDLGGLSAPFPWRVGESGSRVDGAMVPTYTMVMGQAFVSINAELEEFCTSIISTAFDVAWRESVPLLQHVLIVQDALKSESAKFDEFQRLCTDPHGAITNLLQAHVEKVVAKGIAPKIADLEEAFRDALHVNRDGETRLRDSITATAVGQNFRIPDFGGEIMVKYASGQAFGKVCQLYYSMRCVLAHGSHHRTLQAIHDLKFDQADFEGGTREQACTYFRTLLNVVRSLGSANPRPLRLTYRDYVGYLRFAKNFAYIISTSVEQTLFPPPPGDPLDGGLGFLQV